MIMTSEKSRIGSKLTFPLLWLATIVCLAALLRVYNLGGPALWVDEMHRLVWAKGYEVKVMQGLYPYEAEINRPAQSLGTSLNIVNRHNPPLNDIILNLWVRITGAESDFSLRLPFAIFGILTVFVIYVALNRQIGEKAAMVAAFLVAVSPYHVFYSQELNHYSPAFFWISCTFFFFFRILVRPKLIDSIGLFFAGTAAIYTHYFCVIVLLFQGLSFLANRLLLRRVVVQVLPYAAIAAAFAPYLSIMSSQMGEMTSFGGPFQGLSYFIQIILVFLSIPWLGFKSIYLSYLSQWWLVPIGLLTCMAFVVGVYLIDDKPLKRILLLNGTGPICVVSIAYWVTHHSSILWPRYQLFFTFIIFIPIAFALTCLKRRYLVPLAVLLVALIGVGHYFQYWILVKEDWKSVARILSERAEPNDRVLVYSPGLIQSLARYMSRSNVILTGISSDKDFGRQLPSITMASRSSWYVSVWADKAIDQNIQSHLRAYYQGKESIDVNPGFCDLTLTRYFAPRLNGEKSSEDSILNHWCSSSSARVFSSGKRRAWSQLLGKRS
jgi:mannosyltransferase